MILFTMEEGILLRPEDGEDVADEKENWYSGRFQL